VPDVLALLEFGPGGWGDEIAAGAAVTLALSLATLPVGIVVGFFVALAKQSGDKLIRLSAEIYTTIFRGLPELLTLFLVYYGAQYGFSRISTWILGYAVEISAFVAGVVALGLVLSSYASETFLSAFRGIPRGQYEAAFAVGLTRAQAMRLVIVPQLVRLALPGLSNLWLSLMKDTALVSAITLNELLRMTTVAVGNTKQPFLFYGVACLIYLALALASSFGIWRIDRWAWRGSGK
jgi:polar amino acid transport system permease protein